MHTIIWNPQAQENLHYIKAFYQEAGVEEEIIDELLKGIFTATERLTSHPQSGRIVPEIADPNFREIIEIKHGEISTCLRVNLLNR